MQFGTFKDWNPLFLLCGFRLPSERKWTLHENSLRGSSCIWTAVFSPRGFVIKEYILLKKKKKESLSSLYPSVANFHLSSWVSYERKLILTDFWLFRRPPRRISPSRRRALRFRVCQFGFGFNLWPAGAVFFPPRKLSDSQTPKATRYV